MEFQNILYWIGLMCFGAVIALIMLNLPKKILIKVGEKISPNQLSIIHTPIVWMGYFIFYTSGFVLTGLGIVAFSAMLDRLDGKLAHVLDKHFQDQKRPQPKSFIEALSFRGSTDWGKVIDPAMDKLAIIPIYIHIALGYISHWIHHGINSQMGYSLLIGTILIGIIVAVDFAGTIIRMDYFKHMIKSKGATWAGKIKALLQWIWLLFNVFVDQGWVTNFKFEFQMGLNLFLGIVALLGLISLITKMVSWGGHKLTKYFSHD